MEVVSILSFSFAVAASVFIFILGMWIKELSDTVKHHEHKIQELEERLKEKK